MPNKPAPKAKKPTAPVKPRKLSQRQQRFCELIAAGESGTDSWLKAGYKVTRDVARANAAESLAKPNIAARVAELRAPHTASTALSRDRKRELLRDIAESTQASLDARIRAMAEDSKMAGHYEPERIELETGPNTLASARERALSIASPLNRLAAKNKE